MAQYDPFTEPLLQGTLVKRYKRFLADVTLSDGTQITAHCPNSGSMLGLKEPGMDVLVRYVGDPKRKLQYTLEFVRHGSGHWIGVNTSRPNEVVPWAIQAGLVPGLSAEEGMKAEVKYGNENSRIDLLLGLDSGDLHYVEIKNTTLYEDGVALFPDAVTERGAKHMRELQAMVQEGHQATVVFFVNGGDVHAFRPCKEIDPGYAAAFEEAIQAGVEAIPLHMEGGPEGWRVRGVLPIQS